MSRKLVFVALAAFWFSVACLLGTAASAPSSYVDLLAAEQARTVDDAVSYLNGQDEPLALRAALELGRTKLPAAEPPLVAHLNDPRPAVRAMSLYAIGLIASGDQSTAILAGLGDGNAAVRVAALDAIGRYEAAHRLSATDEASALSVIVRILSGDPDPIVRARAAAALEGFGGAAAAADAAHALSTAAASDASVDVRRFAMWTIFRTYAQLVAAPFAARMLRDPDEIVRIEAVRAMARRADPSNVSLLQPLLNDPSWRVQEQTSEAIRLLQGQTMSEHWTAIPAFVHVPPAGIDPLAALPAMPRVPTSGKPRAPVPDRAIFQPLLDPTTAAAMTGPAPGLHPRVRIVTTKGNVYVTFFPEWAPLTVENFLNLVNAGYYDNNRWFRIVPDFVVQTGDQTNTGNGDAGYTIGAEENPLAQIGGVISMGMNYDDKTNTPIRDSAGSQYYITLSPQLHLDRDFTVFGEVTSGFDVLGRLIESDRVIRIERIADQRL